jgi:hypothetical protein
MVREPGPNRLLPVIELCAGSRIPPLRGALPWRFTTARILLWDQCLTMAFAQLTYREGLRDIEACLRSLGGKLYHMGFRGRVARSTLADANDTHDWRIYADFAQVLIRVARPLYASDPIGVDLDPACTHSTRLSSTCLSLFPWARFRKHKAAVKTHTLLDLHGNIPRFISITDGKVHEVNILDEILPEAGAFYVMVRGYLDFQRLYAFTTSGAFFVRAHEVLSIRKLNANGSRLFANGRGDMHSWPNRKAGPATLIRDPFMNARLRCQPDHNDRRS